jgi:branched-subunit amino acid aminotransferase/4-amino-4-deoxychorismate lyase
MMRDPDPLVNRTLLYGEGLFETLRVYRGQQVPLLRFHCRRMQKGAAALGFPFSPEEFEKTVEATVKVIPQGLEARLRVTLEVYGTGRPEASRLVAQWSPLPEADRRLSEGVRICLAPFRRSSSSPLLAFKTTNYFENSYARRWAEDQGFDDALFLNERGEVTEATAANVLLIHQRTLITPPASAGLLPGIARHFLLLSADQIGLQPEERTVTLQDLQEAEEIVLSNAVVEVLPVRHIADTCTRRPPFGWAKSLLAAYRQNVFLWAKS